MSLFYRTLVLVMLRWWQLASSTQRAFYAQQDKQEEKSRRRTEEIEGRGFRILSKGNSLIPLSLSLTLSVSPLPILSLSSNTAKSANASAGICSFYFPLLLPQFLTSLCSSGTSTSSSSSRQHGEQITVRPSWDHGCLPLQRSQRSVPPELHLRVSLRW